MEEDQKCIVCSNDIYEKEKRCVCEVDLYSFSTTDVTSYHGDLQWRTDEIPSVANLNIIAPWRIILIASDRHTGRGEVQFYHYVIDSQRQ